MDKDCDLSRYSQERADERLQEQRDEFIRQLNTKAPDDLGPVYSLSLVDEPSINDELRAQLGTERSMHNAWRKRAEEAELKLQRLSNALQWYADEKNYNDDGAPIRDVFTEGVNCQELDCAATARKALDSSSDIEEQPRRG
ncbi:hypothetical protein ACYOEI_01105 [Singulisphaera rosea]